MWTAEPVVRHLLHRHPKCFSATDGEDGQRHKSAAALGTNRLGKVFNTFGFSLFIWLTSLLRSSITVVFVVICIIITCIKSTIKKPMSTMEYNPLNPAPETDIPLNPTSSIELVFSKQQVCDRNLSP